MLNKRREKELLGLCRKLVCIPSLSGKEGKIAAAIKKAIPTVGFGPSLESLAHISDEYIAIDHLLKAYQGYYSIIGSVLQ